MTDGSSPLDQGSTQLPWKAAVAEGVGTLLFVFLACSSLVTSFFMGASVGLLEIALVHGAAYGGLRHALRSVGPAHFNPALTIGAAAAGELTLRDAAIFVGAQIVGCVAAGLFVGALMPVDAVASTQAGTPVLATGVDSSKAFALELLLTAAIGLAVFRNQNGEGSPGLAAGAVLVATTLIAAPISGAAFNPARAIGPGVVSGAQGDLWLHVLAPVVGGLLAAALCKTVWPSVSESAPTKPGRR